MDGLQGMAVGSLRRRMSWIEVQVEAMLMEVEKSLLDPKTHSSILISHFASHTNKTPLKQQGVNTTWYIPYL